MTNEGRWSRLRILAAPFFTAHSNLWRSTAELFFSHWCKIEPNKRHVCEWDVSGHSSHVHSHCDVIRVRIIRRRFAMDCQSPPNNCHELMQRHSNPRNAVNRFRPTEREAIFPLPLWQKNSQLNVYGRLSSSFEAEDISWKSFQTKRLQVDSQSPFGCTRLQQLPSGLF